MYTQEKRKVIMRCCEKNWIQKSCSFAAYYTPLHPIRLPVLKYTVSMRAVMLLLVATHLRFGSRIHTMCAVMTNGGDCNGAILVVTMQQATCLQAAAADTEQCQQPQKLYMMHTV